MSMMNPKSGDEQDEKEDKERRKQIQQKMQEFFAPYEEYIKVMDGYQTWESVNLERGKILEILHLSKENSQKECDYSTLVKTYSILSTFYNKAIQPFFQRQKSVMAMKKNIEQPHVAGLGATSSNGGKVRMDFLENNNRDTEFVNFDTAQNNIDLYKAPEPPKASTQEYQWLPNSTANWQNVPIQHHVASLPHTSTNVPDMRRKMGGAKSQPRSSSNSRSREYDYTQQFPRSWNSSRINGTAPDNYEKSSIKKKKPRYPQTASEYSSFNISRPNSYSRNGVEPASTNFTPPITFSEFPLPSNYALPASSSNDMIPLRESLALLYAPPYPPNPGPSSSISEPSRSMFTQPQQEMNMNSTYPLSASSSNDMIHSTQSSTLQETHLFQANPGPSSSISQQSQSMFPQLQQEMNMDWQATVPTQHSNTPFMPMNGYESWDMSAMQPLMANPISGDSLPMDYINPVSGQYMALPLDAAPSNHLAPELTALVPQNQFHYQTPSTKVQQLLLNNSNPYGLKDQSNFNMPGMNSHDIGNNQDFVVKERNYQELRSVSNRDLQSQPDNIANGDHSYGPCRDIRTVRYPQQEANPQANRSSIPMKNYRERNFESSRRKTNFHEPKDGNSDDLVDTTAKNVCDETAKTGVCNGTQKKTFPKKKDDQPLPPSASPLPVISKPSTSTNQRQSQTEVEVGHTPGDMKLLENIELSDRMQEQIKKFAKICVRMMEIIKMNGTGDKKARENELIHKSDNSNDDSADKFPEKETESIEKTTTRKENGIPESRKNSSEFGPKSKTKHVENPDDISKWQLKKVHEKEPKVALKKIDTPLQCDNASQDIIDEMNNKQDKSHEESDSSISDRITQRTGQNNEDKTESEKNDDTDVIQEPEEPKSSEPVKDPLSLEQLRAYVWGKTWDCIYCPFNGSKIVEHFITKHPTKEVMISRLSEKVAEDCIEETRKFISNPGQVILKYRCPFCSIVFSHGIPRISMENFYQHCSLHTGEYLYRCAECSFKASDENVAKSHFYNECRKLQKSQTNVNDAVKKVLIPDETEVYGYICSKCNFVQLQKDNLNEHVKKCRSEDLDAVVVQIGMSMKIQSDYIKPDPDGYGLLRDIIKPRVLKKEKVEPEEVEGDLAVEIKKEPEEHVTEEGIPGHYDFNVDHIKTKLLKESDVGLAEPNLEIQRANLKKPGREPGSLYRYLKNLYREHYCAYESDQDEM